MIVTDDRAFAQAMSGLQRRIRPAVPKAVLLIDPEDFRVATESSVDNRYLELTAVADSQRAIAQSAALGRAIASCGVPVIRMPGDPSTPDAVFPNNVFATIPGRLIVGSMRHPGRRREAGRPDIRAFFSEVLGYEIVDLSATDCVAELTGPLVIDRGRNIGFCGMSERVDEAGAEHMHSAFRLDLMYRFPLRTGEYHTNVLMSVLAGRALVLHPPAIANPSDADAIAGAFDAVLELDADECEAFAGNCLAVTDRDVFFSERAVDGLRSRSRAALESWGFRLHDVAVDELEKAGGSVRCMIAEVY